MRKYSWVGFIVAIVLAFSLIPFVDGYLFKNNYLSLLNSINTENQSFVKVKVIDYTLGWFGSSATLQIDQGVVPTQSYSMTVKQQISHGPFVYDVNQQTWRWGSGSIDSVVTFSPLLQMSMAAQGTEVALRMQSLVTFSGDYATQFDSSAFLLKSPPETKILWKGVQGSILAQVKNNSLYRTDIDLTVHDAKSLSGASLIDFGGMTVAVHTKRDSSIGIMTGTYQCVIPHVSIIQSGSNPYVLKGARLSWTASLDNQRLYNQMVKLSFDSFTFPQFLANKTSAEIEFQHLNPQAFLELIRESSHRGAAGVMDHVFPVITPTTMILEKLNMNTSLGDAVLAATIHWTVDPSLLKTVDDIVKYTMLKIDVHVSDALMKKVIESTPFLAPQTPVQPVEVNVAPSEAGLLKKVDDMADANTVKLDVALQLKDLIHRHLPATIFATNLQRFVMTKDITLAVATELTSYYQTLYPVPHAKMPMAPLPPVMHPVVLTPEEQTQLQLDTWVNKGYLVKEGEEYLSAIICQGSQCTFNGLPALK